MCILVGILIVHVFVELVLLGVELALLAALRVRPAPDIIQGRQGNVQGVLAVQHVRRHAVNRNSDIRTDSLIVTINHRDNNSLQSSESDNKLDLHATKPSDIFFRHCSNVVFSLAAHGPGSKKALVYVRPILCI